MRSLAEHLREPSLGDSFASSGAPVAADGCAGGSCGVLAHYRLDVDETGTIIDCAARVRGRASAFATASALCEAARGRTIVEAARLGLTTLHPSFAAMDDDDRERALVAEDGFHHALGRFLLDRMRDAPAGFGADRPAIAPLLARDARPAIVVGMSGGVDSAVALHRCIDDAGDAPVVGATLRLWIDPRAPDPEAACCSPDSVRRARATCHAAGMPHVSIDLRDTFARDVVVPFVDDYASGRTPNPCVRCNGRFRLDELVRLADVLGAEAVATGHYARVVERGGVSLVARGVDPGKDQSYMLGEVAPATVERLRFPLGEHHKREIRAEAAERGLEQATIAGSQEICFLGGGDYREFLARAGASGPSGELVLDAPEGRRVVGRHDGVARFTPGQRKGIGVASHAPLYVLDVDPTTGEVLVGHDDSSLQRTRVAIDELEWHVADPIERINVQLRYRARGGAIPARVVAGDGSRAMLELDDASRAPAPGQAAILYDDEGAVVGSARIARTGAEVGDRSAR